MLTKALKEQGGKKSYVDYNFSFNTPGNLNLNRSYFEKNLISISYLQCQMVKLLFFYQWTLMERCFYLTEELDLLLISLEFYLKLFIKYVTQR